MQPETAVTPGGGTRHLLVPRPYPRKLSLVIPMYNEEATIPMLREAIEPFLKEIKADAEVILVNDGSTDGTIERILNWAVEDQRIKILQLSRNFGHQMAATAGLDYATGDAVVLLDADLQDPLAVIHEMVDRYCEGYDVAYGQREKRAGETLFKRATAWAFYRLMRLLVDRDLPVDTGDFRLFSRRCLTGLRQMRETHRFLRGMTAWVGYPQIAVKYKRDRRIAGETKYPLKKMMGFAWTAATSFSTVPLRLTFCLGLIVGAFSLEEAVRSILSHIFGWFTVSGWSSLMVVLSGLGSALLVSVGILGEYVGRLYEQVKGRPIYLVTDTYNIESDGGPGKSYY
jgi:dolichol-phosphate mannosyltransferase